MTSLLVKALVPGLPISVYSVSNSPFTRSSCCSFVRPSSSASSFWWRSERTLGSNMSGISPRSWRARSRSYSFSISA